MNVTYGAMKRTNIENALFQSKHTDGLVLNNWQQGGIDQLIQRAHFDFRMGPTQRV